MIMSPQDLRSDAAAVRRWHSRCHQGGRPEIRRRFPLPPPSEAFMRTSSWLLGLALVLSFGAAPLAAQHAQTRDGFWFGAGLGYGSLGCDGCGGDRTGGSSGYLKLGGTGSQHLLLGVETTGWGS